MRRLIGTLAINWLRKPENQAKLKRGANEARRRFDEFRDRNAARKPPNAPASHDTGRSTQHATPRSGGATNDGPDRSGR